MNKQIQIESAFKAFCFALENREGLMTEDNIRYYWLTSLLKQDKELNHYTLEYPYKKALSVDLQNEELDLLYQSDIETWCFEMKFHRNGEYESHLPYTNAAGSLINDLMRLQTLKQNATWTNAHYFFLYVTDSEMADYLSFKSGLAGEYMHYREILREFFSGSRTSLSFSSFEMPSMFKDGAGKSLGNKEDISIQTVNLLHMKDTMTMSTSFSKQECYVRLYEIL